MLPETKELCNLSERSEEREESRWKKFELINGSGR